MALYGSTPVSDSFGEGMMENVSMMRLDIGKWHNWKPCEQSQPSASFLTTSNIRLMSSAPAAYWPTVSRTGLAEHESVRPRCSTHRCDPTEGPHRHDTCLMETPLNIPPGLEPIEGFTPLRT